ncbi:flavin reductase family protein [Streptomyces sp. NPDC088747]|uniref:flavin reductase family protein n=1 Tax=Streptomyces sp. NPDC088747 TaxID=3365886 RepID=UPI0038101DC7
MRRVLGQFGTGIVIVTATTDGGPVGMTCQSFASLSLDPPLISLSPGRSSTTWPRIRESGHFCINVLAHDQQELSNAFARSGGDKFAGVSWQAGQHGAPALDGALAWIHCRLWREYDGGDHTIVVGEVLELADGSSKPPLLYHGGRYLAATHNTGH